jgi:hypothetical protein
MAMLLPNLGNASLSNLYPCIGKNLSDYPAPAFEIVISAFGYALDVFHSHPRVQAHERLRSVSSTLRGALYSAYHRRTDQ